MIRLLEKSATSIPCLVMVVPQGFLICLLLLLLLLHQMSTPASIPHHPRQVTKYRTSPSLLIIFTCTGPIRLLTAIFVWLLLGLNSVILFSERLRSRTQNSLRTFMHLMFLMFGLYLTSSPDVPLLNVLFVMKFL